MRPRPSRHVVGRYGAGGVDGDIQLHEYDWGQVSIVRYVKYVKHATCDDKSGDCDYASPRQKRFTLPAIARQSQRHDAAMRALAASDRLPRHARAPTRDGQAE